MTATNPITVPSNATPLADLATDRDPAAAVTPAPHGGPVAGSLSPVQVSSRWLTRGVFPKRVEVVEVDHAAGFATLVDQDGNRWPERVSVIEMWTRRAASLDKLRAVWAAKGVTT